MDTGDITAFYKDGIHNLRGCSDVELEEWAYGGKAMLGSAKQKAAEYLLEQRRFKRMAELTERNLQVAQQSADAAKWSMRATLAIVAVGVLQVIAGFMQIYHHS